MIQLIVGLGNPGEEHVSDRHNAGFWLVDALSKHLNVQLQMDTKFKGLIGHVKFQGQDLHFLEPSTYMNLSGESVGAVAKFYKLKPEEILVIHDELDLAPGTIRLKFSGGTGGHNGLKSMNAHLHSDQYWRLRIGIGHPRNYVEPGQAHQEVASYVLKRPPKLDFEKIEETIQKTITHFDLLLEEDLSSAMKQLHTGN